jgi:hypothetical protein
MAAHPGYSATHLQGHTGSRLQTAIMAVGNKLLAQSDSAGALPTLYAATADLPGGSYVGPDGIGEFRGHPALVGRSKAAQDEQKARGLWDLSERLTGVTWPANAKAPAA